MKFLKAVLFFFFVGVISNLSAQTTGDFRSLNSGNWSDVNNWEYYNGTSWTTPAPYYPGNGATNDVYIINGDIMTLNGLNTTNPINSITIGDHDNSNGIESIEILSSSSINVLNFTIAYDGLLKWVSTSTTFWLTNDNTELIIEKPNPDNNLELGVDHGIYENPPPCSNSQVLEIGTAKKNKYATCQGGGLPSFEEVNNSGGNQSLTVTIIASTTEICLGETITLTAHPSGTAYDNNATTNYTWSATPVNNGLVITNSNITTATPTTNGSYIFEVEVTNSGFTANNTVTVTVNPLPTAPTSSGNITECESSPIQTLDANNAITSSGTITWYDAMTSGNVVSNPTLNSIGSTTYYAEYSNGTCSSTRTAVTLTLNSVPTAPIGASDQKFCSSGNPTITNLTATGTNIQWYTSATGGTALTNTTPLTTNTYYASQSDTNCESSDRLAVNVIISGCRVITNRRITYRVKK